MPEVLSLYLIQYSSYMSTSPNAKDRRHTCRHPTFCFRRHSNLAAAQQFLEYTHTRIQSMHTQSSVHALPIAGCRRYGLARTCFPSVYFAAMANVGRGRPLYVTARLYYSFEGDLVDGTGNKTLANVLLLFFKWRRNDAPAHVRLA